MVNHPNRSRAGKQSIAFCDQLFSRVSGRAHVKIGGEIAGFDPTRNEVFVNIDGRKSIWMPAGSFMQNLSPEEIAELENLPAWNGSNEVALSAALVLAAEHAIRRYRQYEIDSSRDSDSSDYFSDSARFTERIEDGRIVRSKAYTS
jgi:hypothetical protein